MKIAIFTDTYYPQINGVARTLKRFTDYLSSNQIDFELFVPDLDQSLEYPHVHQFTSLPFVFYPECRTALALPTTIIEKVKAFSPDIIHVTTPLTMGLLGVYTAKRLSIPLISSYHTHFEQYLEYYKLGWLSPLVWKYVKWFYHFSERVLVPSKETQDHLFQNGFKQLSIWSRGVDSELYHPFYDKLKVRRKWDIHEKYIFIYVGRLAPEKDLDTLVGIISGINRHLPGQVHWLIVGDGPSFQDLEKQLHHYPHVTLTGYLKGQELAEAYALSDVLVFPSQTETFGNVVLEAFAAGTPALVSNRGGVTGIVQHNQTGKICRAGEVDDFIVNLLDMLLNNTSDLMQLSENARSYALSQSWESIFSKLLDEYGEIIEMSNQSTTKLA